ncbi:MAG: ATP-binding protein [Aquabacterium sp.]
MFSRTPDTGLNDAALTATRLWLHRRHAPTSIVATVAACALLSTLLWPAAGHAVLLPWVAAVMLALVLRTVVWHMHRRRGARERPWLAAYRVAFALHGVAWSSLVLGSAWVLPRDALYLLVLGTASVVAVSIVSTAHDRLSGVLFAVPVLVPLLLRCFGVAAEAEPGVGALVLLLVAMMSAVARRTADAMRTGVALELQARVRADEAELARRQLADQHHMLSQLMRTTSQGYWFTDQEGRTVDLNDAMCTLLGRPREQVMGRLARDFIAPADVPALDGALQARQQGERSAYEVRLQRPDSTLLLCHNNATPLYDAAGAAIGSVGLWTDLSARLVAERALSASEARSRALLEAFPGYISTLDSKLRYTFVNTRLATLLGRPAQQLVGLAVKDVLDEARERLARDEFDRALAGEEVRAERHFPATATRPCLDLELSVVAGPVGDDGQPTVFGFATDITARKIAEEALIAARDEAEQANQAKSQFLTHMSHELRTPLNAVIGFAQVLQIDPTLAAGPRHQAQLQEIVAGGRHLLGLIEGLLDLGRIETGQLVVKAVPVPLAPLFNECLGLMQAVAGPRGIHLLPAPAVPLSAAVCGDSLRIKQVLLNLLANGVKYNRRNGHVELVCRPEADGWRIEVHDTGPGLDAAQCARLFQPFERLQAAGSGVEGTGIGLALSRRLIEAMGGTIGVTSEPGMGSCFWLTLPRAPAGFIASATPDAPQASARATTPAGASGGTEAEWTGLKRVLYIEDNEINRIVMQAMLSRLPQVCLETAGSAEEGLQRCRDHPPDLLLLDIQLPGMDGLQLFEQLRAQPATRRVPVVAVSADGHRARIDAALAMGFAAYLTKPMDLATLSRTVQQLLARSP